jgi:hypothetical protein
VPNSNEAWDNVVKHLEEKWNFNNCIGAMDGKVSHKKWINVVQLLAMVFLALVFYALVDACYRFIIIRHWLPVEFRIQWKLLLTVIKALQEKSLAPIQNLVGV